MTKPRLILSEDKQTAILDGEIRLKTEPMKEVCEGCFFLREDNRCNDIVEHYSQNGTYCSTNRLVIWVKQ